MRILTCLPNAANSRIFFGLAALAAILMIASASCGGSRVDTSEIEALDAYERGLDLRDQGNLRDAFEEFDKALNLNPRLAEAYAERASIYYAFDDEVRAIADINRALKLNANLAIAHNYKGVIFSNRNDTDSALISYTKAIQLAPGLTSAYFNRARLYFELGDLDAAIADLTSAIEQEPQKPEYYLSRGQIYILNDDNDRGVADLEQVLALTDQETLVIRAKELLSLVQ